MIIITGTILIRIDQGGTITVFKLLFYKVNVYRKAHDHLLEYSDKFVFRGTGIEKLKRS